MLNIFFGCIRLTTIKLPRSLKTIGAYAFQGCSMSSITIPNSVTNMDSDPFAKSNGYGCYLTKVTLEWKEPAVNASVFKNDNDFSRYLNPLLIIPKGCTESYSTMMGYGVGVGYCFFNLQENIDNNNYIAPVDLTACRSGSGNLSVRLKNLNDIIGFQFDLILPQGVSICTNTDGRFIANLTNRKVDHTLSVSKVEDNHYRFVSVSINNNKYDDETEEDLLRIKLKVDDSVEIGTYGVKVKDTELTSIDDDDMIVIDSKDCTALLAVQEAELGDVNGDMKISVTDVSCIIGNILNDTPATFIERAADLNGDNKVSVTDAVIVIDKILNEGKPYESRKFEETEKEPQ